MFYIDKYAPTKYEDIIFHKNELEKLKIMSQDNAIPHLIFYGPYGSGKRKTIELFLLMLYDESVKKLKDVTYYVVGNNNITTEVIIKQSNYYIIIEPNNNNFDKYYIQNIIKDYIKQNPLNIINYKKKFRTVLINNIDYMSYYAQISLRRTIEKYSNVCRFIMNCHSLSKVIEPLRSRCYCFRIKAPSEIELFKMMINIAGREQICMNINDYHKIIDISNRNIKNVLWLMQIKKSDDKYETSFDNIIDLILKKLIENNMCNLLEIRKLLYDIIITNINGTLIIKKLIDTIISNKLISEDKKIKIIEAGAHYEHDLIRGRREMLSLEALIINIMNILHNPNININRISI